MLVTFNNRGQKVYQRGGLFVGEVEAMHAGILKHYIRALAFKVLSSSDIAYVDGSSGRWQTKTEDFSDSFFMIEIPVLQDTQKFFKQCRNQNLPHPPSPAPARWEAEWGGSSG